MHLVGLVYRRTGIGAVIAARVSIHFIARERTEINSELCSALAPPAAEEVYKYNIIKRNEKNMLSV